jgi:hypothetical protein
MKTLFFLQHLFLLFAPMIELSNLPPTIFKPEKHGNDTLSKVAKLMAGDGNPQNTYGFFLTSTDNYAKAFVPKAAHVYGIPNQSKWPPIKCNISPIPSPSRLFVKKLFSHFTIFSRPKHIVKR